MLLPQEHSVIVRQTSKWGQLFLLALVGVGATAIGTAWLYRLDEIVTVKGKLVPQEGGVEVKSPVNGQLAQILVSNGEKVKQGQVLLRFDVKSNVTDREINMQQLKLENKRLDDQLKSNNKRQETIQRNINLTKAILDKLMPLEESGAISELQILTKLNELETKKDELILLKTRQREITNDSGSRDAEIKGKLKQIDNRLRNEKIRAPIDGIVFNLKPDNNRYVALNAEPLLNIVPDGKLGAEVKVSNKDIGFISAGQKVKVRIDTFPYTEYGELDGKIIRVGADALPPDKTQRDFYFPVDIELNKSELKTREGVQIPLQAGMTITTNLKLRDRRLIELVSDLFSDRGDGLKRLRKP